LRKVRWQLSPAGKDATREKRKKLASQMFGKSYFVVDFSSVWSEKFFAPPDFGEMLIKAEVSEK
jgi:hypothetical protein